MKNTGNEILDGFSVSLCNGRCTVSSKGQDYPVAGYALVLTSSVHDIRISEKSYGFAIRTVSVPHEEILEFPSPVDLDVIKLSISYPVIPLSESEAACLRPYYDLLERQNGQEASSYRKEISHSIVYALMLEICDTFRTLTGRMPGMSRPKQEILTDDFFKLLSRYYRTEHNVGFYADRLNRTPKYLSGAIRRLSGKSVPDWIDSALTREIKMLLKTTDKTVLEISEELNFSSPSVFIQFFRRNAGLTPLQYRKKG